MSIINLDFVNLKRNSISHNNRINQFSYSFRLLASKNIISRHLIEDQINFVYSEGNLFKKHILFSWNNRSQEEIHFRSINTLSWHQRYFCPLLCGNENCPLILFLFQQIYTSLLTLSNQCLLFPMTCVKRRFDTCCTF